MLLQGAYLAHLTQLTSLWTRVELDANDLLQESDDAALELASYPTSLRNIEFVISDSISLRIGSFPAACPGLRVSLRSVEDAQGCEVALSHASRHLLWGQSIVLNTHVLTIHVDPAFAALVSRSPATCLVKWVAESGAESVTIDPPVRTGFGRVVMLKFGVDDKTLSQYLFELKLYQELSRASVQFGLTCSIGRHGVELRRSID